MEETEKVDEFPGCFTVGEAGPGEGVAAGAGETAADADEVFRRSELLPPHSDMKERTVARRH